MALSSNSCGWSAAGAGALTVIIASLGLSAPGVMAGAPEETAAFKTAIRAKYDMKEAAFAANDPEPILTRFYSEDAISTDPEGHTHVGRDALRPVYEEVIVNDVKIESYKSVVNGDAGWDWANFNVIPAEGTGMEPFTFKMLFLWQRDENGEWWSHGEMYVHGKFDIQ